MSEPEAIADPPPSSETPPRISIELCAAKAFVPINEYARRHGYRTIVILVADDGTLRWHHDNGALFEGAVRSIVRLIDKS